MFSGASAGRVLAAATTIAVLLGVTACGGGRPSPPDGDTGYDLRYGAAPSVHPDVTLQPDVVIVGGGSGSVRSVTDGGLTWRLDPTASRADQLAPGKVMFVTGRGVGRVIDVRRDGDDLAVTIGPVDITELIQDGTFTSDQPISLADATAYEIADPFWSQPDESADTPSPARTAGLDPARTARTVQVAGAGGTRPVSARGGGLNVRGVCCANGVGARFSYHGGGATISGSIALVMSEPSASFHLEVRGSTITRAELQINGAAGVRVKLDAHTETGANVHPTDFAAVDFSVPIATILGIPLSATVRQAVGLRTGFSAANSTLAAAGEYSMGGAIGFGYANGTFGPRWPGGFQDGGNLAKSIFGVSIGANTVLVDYAVKFYIGIGVAGFTAGPFVGLDTTVGITRGSSVGFGGLAGFAAGEGCNRADLYINATYGIGYTIPALVAKVINFFLRIFNAKPIATHNTIPKRPPLVSLVHLYRVTPDLPVCQS